MLKKIITSLYKIIFYHSIHTIYYQLKKRDITDFSSNSTYQIGKLTDVLNKVYSTVPYYENMNISVDFDNLIYSEFQKIPVLTKDIIRKNGKLLINRDYKSRPGVFENTSGGSTGEPVIFFQTKNQSNHGIANYFYALFLNGVSINDTSVDLWGAERDMHENKKHFDIRTLLHNKITLNTFVMSDVIMADYIKQINKIKPKFIKAYVHSIYELSKYINNNRIKIGCKPTIHCTTGPLYPEMKIEIEKAFNNALVYNFYGSREVSAIASEVHGNEGMFVLYDNVLVEVLDKNNQPVKKGEEGEIVVTTLNNIYMPLIRYKIGDRAIKGDDLEFGSLKLDSVIGRTLGVIHKGDGTTIDGQYFTTLFFNKPGIQNFQLIQKTLSELQLNIVKTEIYNQIELDMIIAIIQGELENVRIDINFCDKITLTETGKIMYVYSELN